MRSNQPNKEPLRAAFDAQAKPSLLDKLFRATRARIRVYTPRSQDVNAADVDDMMMGVIVDTLDGTLAWEYERKPLQLHLEDAVKYRVRDEAHARWRETARVMELDEELTDVSVGEGALSGAVPERVDHALYARGVAHDLVADVRKLIVGDRDVEQLFEAIVTKRALERADIMNETGLSAKAYKNARRRLDTILLELPNQIRNAVMDAFTN